MADLIDRAALIEKRVPREKTSDLVCQMVTLKDVLEAPAVDSVPVKHGAWIVLAHFFDDEVCTQCPFCKEEYTYKVGKFQYINAEYPKYNYCPNCGAKLDGGRDGEVTHWMPIDPPKEGERDG